MATITSKYEYDMWWTVVSFGDVASQMPTVTKPTQKMLRKFKNYAYEQKRYGDWCASNKTIPTF